MAPARVTPAVAARTGVAVVDLVVLQPRLCSWGAMAERLANRLIQADHAGIATESRARPGHTRWVSGQPVSAGRVKQSPRFSLAQVLPAQQFVECLLQLAVEM